VGTFLLTAPPRSNVRLIIVYIALNVFVDIVFIYRIKKQTFKKYHWEMVSLMVSVAILSISNDIPLLMRATAVSLFLLLYLMGHLMQSRNGGNS